LDHLTQQQLRQFADRWCVVVFAGRPQVSVNLQTSRLRVCVRDGDGEKTLMEGEFTHKINTENSLWSLEPGSCVVVSMQSSSRFVDDPQDVRGH